MIFMTSLLQDQQRDIRKKSEDTVKRAAGHKRTCYTSTNRVSLILIPMIPFPYCHSPRLVLHMTNDVVMLIKQKKLIIKYKVYLQQNHKILVRYGVWVYTCRCVEERVSV